MTMPYALGKRIAIIGGSGAGKSTLARKLGEILNLPVIHLDKEFWSAGWVQPQMDEWDKKQEALLSGAEWVADGNYGRTLEIRLEKADTVIFLDFGRFTCLHGVIKRWITCMGKTRPDMAEGCPEKIDFAFLKFIWQFNKKTRPVVVEKLSRYKEVKVIVLKNRKELTQFVRGIQC